MIRYYTLLTMHRKNTFKKLVLGEDDCQIINNLIFSMKLCNTAGHFYSSVFIFSCLKAQKNKKNKNDS